MAKKDRRKESRIPYQSIVDLNFSKKKYDRLKTRDLSVMGAYVEGLAGPKKGALCDIKLQLSGEASELLLKLKGEVVRVEDDGVALEFVEVKKDCFYHLKNIAYIIHSNPDDIICNNYKKPKARKMVVNDDEPVKADYDDDVEDYDDEDDDL